MLLRPSFKQWTGQTRVGFLVAALLVCLLAAVTFHLFRPPVPAPAGTEDVVQAEPRKVSVQIPDELLLTPEEYLETDVASLISIRESEDVAALRADLTKFLWGRPGLPATFPDRTSIRLEDSGFDDIAAISSIDELVVQMEFGIESHVFHFQPKNPNGAVLLFHQGHRGDFQLSKSQIGAFLEQGYSVAALAMPLLGRNSRPTVQLPNFGRLKLTEHDQLKLLTPSSGHPIQYFIEPVIATVNYLASEQDYSSISMVGISGGGWTATIAAAIDPRISASFPVAGSYPLYLRSNSQRDWGDYEQTVPELYRIANYLDLYILGAYGPARSQLQIINQLDPCCFAGTKWDTYASHVQERVEELGSGSYSLFMDDTHWEHDISPVAMDRILLELSQAVDRESLPLALPESQ